MPHFLISLLLVLAVGLTITAAADDTPPFKITTRRDSDRVTVKSEMGKVTFSVHSPIGISNAVIERPGGKWPDSMVLRLHLKGLENFKITDGKVKLEGSVSLHDGRPVVRIWKDGKEDSLLDAASPFWIEARMIGSDGKPAKGIPLNDGYFEMQLPSALFEGRPKSITVAWIEFYRN